MDGVRGQEDFIAPALRVLPLMAVPGGEAVLLPGKTVRALPTKVGFPVPVQPVEA